MSYILESSNLSIFIYFLTTGLSTVLLIDVYLFFIETFFSNSFTTKGFFFMIFDFFIDWFEAISLDLFYLILISYLNGEESLVIYFLAFLCKILTVLLVWDLILGETSSFVIELDVYLFDFDMFYNPAYFYAFFFLIALVLFFKCFFNIFLEPLFFTLIELSSLGKSIFLDSFKGFFMSFYSLFS